MAGGKLYIGTRRYSSWSLRGWLAVRLARLDVEEVVIPLAGGSTPAVKAVSPNGLVPYLEHDGNRVWETIAICEYCAEVTPALWPADRPARTRARVIAAEMHAGFTALRQAMPMNLGIQRPGVGHTRGRARRCEACRGDLARDAEGIRRRRAVPVRGGDECGGCDVCACGRTLPRLRRAARSGFAHLLRSSAQASARRRMVRRRCA